jgi:hypothetical protein
MLKEKLWKENGSEVQVRTVLRTMSKRTGVFERTGVGAKVMIKGVLLAAWNGGATRALVAVQRTTILFWDFSGKN